MSLTVRWQNLIGSYASTLVPLTLLAPARNIQTYKATKAKITQQHKWNRIKLLLLIKLWLNIFSTIADQLTRNRSSNHMV